MKKQPLNLLAFRITTVVFMLIFATTFICSPAFAATKPLTVQQMTKKISKQQNTIELLKLKLSRCSGESYHNESNSDSAYGSTPHDNDIPPAINAPLILKPGEPMMTFP